MALLLNSALGCLPCSSSVSTPLAVLDNMTDTVTANDQLVYAGAGSTINVAEGVTHFRLAAHPGQTAWSLATIPSIIQAGSTLDPTVPSRLFNSEGDTVDVGRVGTQWLATAPAVGAGGAAHGEHLFADGLRDELGGDL